MAVQNLGSLTVDLVANTAGFERGMNQAERALASATRETKKQGEALDRLIGQIDPTVAAYSRLDKMEQQLQAHRKAGRLPTEDYEAYIKQINASRDAIAKTDRVMAANGQTAKAYAANLRGIPAQFTDIATSLAAGQNPLTVFLQQGGQLKDMFGGIGPAAKALGGYVLGLVNPFTIAAAAAAALALAYKQGSDEQTAFQNALILSGNAAGTNADQLASQAVRVGQAVGTVGAAADVLAQLAGSGKIPAEQFDMIAIAALKFEEATGTAASETVKNFEKIAKDPVKAIKDLNDNLNFLTTAQFAQIDALKRQGDAAGAANLAEKLYAEALTSRAEKIQDNLGYVESAWKIVRDAAKGAWDAFNDVGRPDTLEQKLNVLKNRLIDIQQGVSSFSGVDSASVGVVDDGGAAAVQKQITDNLVEQEEIRKRLAAQQIEQGKETKGIANVEALNKALEESAPKADKLAKRLKEIDAQIASASSRGVKYTQSQIDQLRKAAEDQFKPDKVAKTPAYREDAGMKMLDALRQQGAALQLQSETNVKLGTQAQALAKFEQELADIKTKKTLTADQKSLLASEDLLRAQLKRNVAIEGEIKAREEALSNAQKLSAFQDTQNSKLDQARENLNAQLEGAGMGDKARERLKEDNRIQLDYLKERDRLTRDYNAIQEPTAGQTELFENETTLLEEALAERLVMQEDYYNQVDEMNGNFFLGMSEAWANYAEEATNYQQQAADATSSILNDVTASVASNIQELIKGNQSVGDFFKNIAADMASAVISALTKMAAQWLVYAAVQLIAGKTAQAGAATTLIANAQATAFQATLAAFASTAAIPIVGPFAAPAAAAAAASFAAPLVAGVASSALAGMAHDGIDSVPQTGTWLLQKGERVTTAQTSAKLDKTLDSMKSPSGMGGNVQVNMIEDASRAGQRVERVEDDQRIIDLFVSNIMNDGETAEAMNTKYGLRTAGR